MTQERESVGGSIPKDMVSVLSDIPGQTHTHAHSTRNTHTHTKPNRQPNIHTHTILFEGLAYAVFDGVFVTF